MEEHTMQSTIPEPPNNGDEVMPLGLSSRSTQSHGELDQEILSHQAQLREVQQVPMLERAGKSDFNIPVRLTAVQRRIYRSLILDHAVEIESYCQDPASLELRLQIERLICRLSMVTVHPLLLAEGYPSSQLSITDEAWYIIQASSKFELLAELIETLRHQPIKILVFSGDSRLSALLETVFNGLRVRCSQGGNQTSHTQLFDDTVGDVQVVIQPLDSPYSGGDPIDLCICFDNRGRPDFAPTLRLIANNSVEHVHPQAPDALVTTISTIANLSTSVGICSHDAGDVVRKIVQFLRGQPLDLEELQDLTFPSSQYDLVSYAASNNGQDQTPPNKKRKIADMIRQTPDIIVTKIDGYETHTEAQLEDTRDSEMLLISEEQAIATQADSYTLSSRQDQVSVFDLAVPHRPEGHEQAQFVSPIHLEKRPTQDYCESPREIWTKTTPDQEKILTLEADIERIMHRFDDLREECRTCSEEKEEALNRANILQKRIERITEEARTARVEKNDLKMELDRMKMPSLPDESDPDYLTIENTRLLTELDKAKKSSETKTQDFEFVRQQYQQSSSAAAAFATENESLKSELASIKNKSPSGLGYKLAVMQSESLHRVLREDLENITLRNNVLVEQLRRMREEKIAWSGREGRRDLSFQDRRRATSASDVGHRKKVDKVGTSRLSVASLISPTSTPGQPEATSTQGHIMVRGQSHDSVSYGRHREGQITQRRDRTTGWRT